MQLADNRKTGFPRRARAYLAGFAAIVAGAGQAGQLDSATYFALDRGMSESEVLVRAGPPDLVTHPGGRVIVDRRITPLPGEDPRLSLLGDYEVYREVQVKEFHYIPDHREHDPHLTVVTLRGGRVWEIERTKLLTRPKAPAASASSDGAPRALSDADIRLQRAERVLTAAESYAATRARLKAQANAGETAPAGEAGEVYSGVTGEGVPYFGDSPPAGD